MLLLGIIFYLSSLVLGAFLSEFFFSEYVSQRVIRFAMGIPIGFALASYSALAFKILTKDFNQVTILLAILLMLAVSVSVYEIRAKKGRLLAKPKGIKLELLNEFKDYRFLYCSIFLISFLLIIMQYKGLSQSGSGLIGADNYGVDYLFHLGIGNSLIHNGFPPGFPYAAGAINVYPFIPDFYSAILVNSGMGLVIPFYLMNFLLYFSIVAIGSYLFYVLSKNQLLPAFAMIMFLFCGEGLSLIIMGILNAPIFQMQPSSLSLLLSNPIFLITYPYFNFDMPLINNFAPQHEYLLGFPYSLVIITIAYMGFLNAKRCKLNYRTSAFLGVMLGFLPLVHPQSFVVLMLFGAVLLTYTLYAKKGSERLEMAKHLLTTAIIGLAIASVELLFMHSQPLGGKFISNALTNPIWYGKGDSIIWLMFLHVLFWLSVFGPILVIGLAGIFLINRRQVLLFIPPIIMLAILNFIWFPPGFGDSNKYTVYLVFFLAFSSAIVLEKLLKSRRTAFKALSVLLFVSVIFSGLFGDLRSDITAVYPVADSLALNASSWLMNNTNPNSLFVTNCYKGTFDFLPSIASRNTLLDMETYTLPIGIYSYNINLVSQNIDSMMQNPSCNLIKEYNVSYFVVDRLNYMIGPQDCVQANYNALANSNNLSIVAYFQNQTLSENITVFRTTCGS